MTTTVTQTLPTTIKVTGEREKETFHTTLPLDLSKYQKLSPEQVGHLRHYHNLASQPDGEWRFMGAADPGQEFLDAYRYQLATMVYAASLTHYHRLPALRTVFKPLVRQLIQKMLRRDVWGYWFLTSHGNVVTDPSLKELRKPWADPVIKENIMYSGHLLLMISLYAMLFDDDEFEKEDSIVFKWDPVFFGFGPENFKYCTQTLQKVILDEMEKNNWVGVCCEPNVVFIICNQFPVSSSPLPPTHPHHRQDHTDHTPAHCHSLQRHSPRHGRSRRTHAQVHRRVGEEEWLLSKRRQVRGLVDGEARPCG